MQIRYIFGKSFVGPVMAAFTGQGACAIEFGEDRASLTASLATRFPGAIIRQDQELAEPLDAIVAFIKEPGIGLDVPLDLHGTPFQQRVWQALQTIAPGRTRTYSQVAQGMGIPDSVRAVASACARNRLAVVVPCHRVVRKDGSLGGYYWGLERKRKLLENEQNGLFAGLQAGDAV